MRKDLKEKLDKAARWDKLANLKIGLIITGAFVAFILVLLPLFPSKVISIEGTATQLSAVQTDDGSMPIMMVRIDDGSLVKASLSNNLQFRKGARVEVLMKESIVGTKSYSVIKYAK